VLGFFEDCVIFPGDFLGSWGGGGGWAVWAGKVWETKIDFFSTAGLVGGRAVWEDKAWETKIACFSTTKLEGAQGIRCTNAQGI